MDKHNVIAGIHFKAMQGLMSLCVTVCKKLNWTEEHFKAFIEKPDEGDITDEEREAIMELFNCEWRWVFNSLNIYRDKPLAGVWLVPMNDAAIESLVKD